MSGRPPRGQMSSAERLRLQRREKQAAYLRSIGQPLYVDPAPVVRHAQWLNRRGMTAAQMSAQSGISKSSVHDYVRGTRTADRGGQPLRHIPRALAAKFLAIRFEPPADLGADLDGTGLRRRLRALARAGYSGPVLGVELGVSHRRVSELMTNPGNVKYSTIVRVEQLYDKLSMVSPEEYGASQVGIVRARNAATRNGYAPPHCWDPDTIDDPEAIPEWTGECGTSRGLHIHYRDQILPACGPCLATRQQETPAAGRCSSSFSGHQLRAFRKKRGLSEVDFAQMVGVDKSTLYYWESGRSAPRSRDRLQQLCDLLGCMESDLTEES